MKCLAKSLIDNNAATLHTGVESLFSFQRFIPKLQKAALQRIQLHTHVHTYVSHSEITL
jgi:hypothetical protein